MKKHFLYISLLIAVVLISCTKNTEKPTIYGNWQLIETGDYYLLSANPARAFTTIDNAIYSFFENKEVKVTLEDGMEYGWTFQQMPNYNHIRFGDYLCMPLYIRDTEMLLAEDFNIKSPNKTPDSSTTVYGFKFKKRQ